jgi:3-oxoacyl-[acyl-carrier protein] reductase
MTRHALVTGGGTGLGLAITRRLVADGLAVTIVGRRADVLARVADELGDPVSTCPADLTDPEAVARLADRMPDRLDVMVHNAGGTSPTTGHTLADIANDWIADYRLNVGSAVLGHAALQDRLARPGGRIIVMSSVAALRGSGSYGAAKGALNVWVAYLASEQAGFTTGQVIGIHGGTVLARL